MNDESRDGRPRAAATRPAALTRSRRQKMIGGVCGGAGRYFGIDPVVFRVVLAIVALSGGIGLVVYGIGWLLIPMDGEDETEMQRLMSGRVEGSALTAVLCVLGGSALFLSTLGNGNNELFSFLLLGALVAAVYWSRQGRSRSAPGSDGEALTTAGGAALGTPPAAGPPPAAMPSWWREPRPGSYLWGPDDGPAPGEPERPLLTKTGYGKPAQTGYEAQPPTAARTHPLGRDRQHRQGRSLFGFGAFMLAVSAAATAIGLSWQHRPLGTTLEIGLVAALGVLVLSLITGAFLGRASGGTFLWTLVVAVLLAGAATLPKSVGTNWGDLTWRPASAAQLQPRYLLGTGQAVLDLTGLDLRGRTVATSAEVGAGRLLVRVPQDATVQLNAAVGLGELRLPDSGRRGFTNKPRQATTVTVTLPPPAGHPSSGTVSLRLNVGLGQLEVLRGNQPG